MPEDSLVRDVGRTLGGYVEGKSRWRSSWHVFTRSGTPSRACRSGYYWALISGAVNVIPFVGSLIGVALTAYVMLLNNGGMWNYLGILITFVVVQGPRRLLDHTENRGTSRGLLPLYVFLAVLIGGMMFGPVGVLLAAPILAVLGVLWRHAAKRRATV